jgi:hypothetical protein
LRAFAQITEPDGIRFIHTDLIKTIDVGHGAPSRTRLHADGFHGVIAGAVENVALDRIFLCKEGSAT